MNSRKMIISNIYFLFQTFNYSIEFFLDNFKNKYTNSEKPNKLLLFDILDYIIDQGNMNIWSSISSKKFFPFILDILKSKNDIEIENRLLELIQKWGIDFEDKKEVIPNFYKIYNKFKSEGVEFPLLEFPNYYKNIFNSEPPIPNDANKNYDFEDNIKNDNSGNAGENQKGNGNNNDNNNDFSYIEIIKNKLKESNFEEKYKKLVLFLINMNKMIKLANTYINERKTNELEGIINELKNGNKTIIDTISSGSLQNEKLMGITLGITEDVNQTLLREEEMRKGNNPNKFISYFINEMASINKDKNDKIKVKKNK